MPSVNGITDSRMSTVIIDIIKAGDSRLCAAQHRFYYVTVTFVTVLCRQQTTRTIQRVMENDSCRAQQYWADPFQPGTGWLNGT